MRTLLLILMMCVLSASGADRRTIMRNYRGPSGASITVNYWEDFEFGSDGDNPTALQLEANHAPYTNDWTLGGTTTLMYVRTAGQKAFTSTINGITDSGTRGLELDINGSNTGARYHYLRVTNGANATSFAVWYKANSLVTSVNTAQPIIIIWNNVGVIQNRILMGTDSSGNPKLAFDNGVTNGTVLTLVSDAWYRLEVLSQNNTLSSMTVYDTSDVSQGVSTATGAPVDFSYVVIGNANTYVELGSLFFDNLLVNKSGASPIGP